MERNVHVLIFLPSNSVTNSFIQHIYMVHKNVDLLVIELMNRQCLNIWCVISILVYLFKEDDINQNAWRITGVLHRITSVHRPCKYTCDKQK